MEAFLLTFIPIFVAIDPIGLVPMFLALTEGVTSQEKVRLAFHAAVTALAVGLFFQAAGHYIFMLLGITPADFKVAGGLLLLIFSIREIFGNSSKSLEGTHDNFIGIVPLGIPLIAGPALITTLLILGDMHSFFSIAFSLACNLLIVFVLFAYADRIVQKIGGGFGKAIAKVVAIVLAAIGIMMIRKGIESFLVR